MIKQEYAYWMALAHMRTLWNARKNEWIVRCFEEKMDIIGFFNCSIEQWKELFAMTDKEIELVTAAIGELPNYSFMVEDLLEQGYEMIPITSPDYPPMMKKNLKRTYAPPLIYVKGNKQLLKESIIAIVGSRNANEISLCFADNVAKTAAQNSKVVVSGFAKGVDKQALDSTLTYQGKSIIVLPQGIMTFGTGFKKHYKEIANGSVLVLSTFQPKAPWGVELAMARNPIIYGLAESIYVAESDSKGGTWSGVIDGLKKEREIFVRVPLPSEKNANTQLIQHGATPVNEQGIEVDNSWARDILEERSSIESKIINLLSKGEYTSKDIITRLSLDWTTAKMTGFLKQHSNIEIIKKSTLKFRVKGFPKEANLFE